MKINYYFFVFIVIIFFISCKDNKKKCFDSIDKYVKNNWDNPKNFELVQYSDVDSLFENDIYFKAKFYGDVYDKSDYWKNDVFENNIKSNHIIIALNGNVEVNGDTINKVNIYRANKSIIDSNLKIFTKKYFGYKVALKFRDLVYKNNIERKIIYNGVFYLDSNFNVIDYCKKKSIR